MKLPVSTPAPVSRTSYWTCNSSRRRVHRPSWTSVPRRQSAISSRKRKAVSLALLSLNIAYRKLPLTSSSLAHQRRPAEGDVGETHLALFKLLIAVFEHSYTRIIETLNTPRSITLLRRLLLITCFPGCFGSDEQVSDLGLPIWAYLQEEISDNGIVATESGFGDPRWATVREVFEALVTGLIVKATYPPDDDYRSWPKGEQRTGLSRRMPSARRRSLNTGTLLLPLPDIKQGFSRYRSDVGDCLINAFYVLRNKMLGDLVQIANAQLNEIAEGRQNRLETLEAVLYCVTAIKEAVPDDEDTFLPLLFGGPIFAAFLGTVGPGSDRVKNTVLRLIGKSTLDENPS